MKTTNFLLRLKLQKGIGYVKMLKIASQLDTADVNLKTLMKMDLPSNLKRASLAAYNDDQAEIYVKRIKKQCQVISFFDDVYPEQLRQIYRPPLVLFAQGDVNLLQQKIVTIVGSRMATSYSRSVMTKLVPRLVKKGWVIASGLAKGVDVMAHQAALTIEGKTIAVVGNGLNHFYPLSNYHVQEQIIRRGLILSEYLPDTPPRPFRFPQRNRILAGIAQKVIVTEAQEKSGSLITANLALQENRDIYAVPGPIDNELSAGPNKLIAAGAIPITDYQL
ncbi:MULTISPECIES: DNA-processing protein DprA [Lactobacillus]|uniref:DNA-processing protein DprA n=1 Tax=Lactobacillus TaxID=1578 RepID=UPI001C6A84FA|nr:MULTISPECIES: DNA-processing protein DprA [Lactobacillus]MCX8721111.1 DNA-processing protein DprA [Lactobacillus sp. B4010]MCX8722786.1 DNA-processing protein DprA [Lactobacillus sp. B4005]MCX8732060.1 DNA-processing protein DprA [Lactobacillus sp. B4015]MCX8734253.1 DNA-processing protein DprA [Lactobacillus sp. B4012]QYN56586.1 DNA-protecting protein DprA [Lactobacillus panisapium]